MSASNRLPAPAVAAFFECGILTATNSKLEELRTFTLEGKRSATKLEDK